MIRMKNVLDLLGGVFSLTIFSIIFDFVAESRGINIRISLIVIFINIMMLISFVIIRNNNKYDIPVCDDNYFKDDAYFEDTEIPETNGLDELFDTMELNTKQEEEPKQEVSKMRTETAEEKLKRMGVKKW